MIIASAGKTIVLASIALVAALPAAGQSSYVGTGVSHGGVVRGTVRLQGPPAGRSTDPVTKDEAVCGKRKPSPRLLCGKGSGVQNTVVWIDGIARGKKWAPGIVATLTQHQCEYAPHVLLLGAQDQLDILNTDPILHNVHTYDLDRSLASVFNIAQPVRGFRTHIRPASIGGIRAMMTTCDAGHPWMSAYVLRAPSPYCVVTDAAGNFRLDDVPAGTYTLRMWHEGVAASSSRGGPGTPPVVEEPYTQSREIVVRGADSLSVEFVLSLRAPVASN